MNRLTLANGGDSRLTTVISLLTVNVSIATTHTTAALERVPLRIMLSTALPRPFWHDYLSVYLVSFFAHCRIVFHVKWFEWHMMGEQLMCQFFVTRTAAIWAASVSATREPVCVVINAKLVLCSPDISNVRKQNLVDCTYDPVLFQRANMSHCPSQRTACTASISNRQHQADPTVHRSLYLRRMCHSGSRICPICLTCSCLHRNRRY